jgi:hypothetical protein
MVGQISFRGKDAVVGAVDKDFEARLEEVGVYTLSGLVPCQCTVGRPSAVTILALDASS